MSYDTSTIISSQVKPEQQKVEITMKLNTDCPNFDRSKGEQIALNVDGCDSDAKANPDDGEELFPESLMDRVVLSSTKTVSNTGRYAVGILDGNEFHLTPLSAILSLRPNFEYLDKSDKTAKQEGRVDNEEDADEPSEESQVKQVNVRFARAGSSREKQQKNSFEMQQKKLKEEPWTRVRFNHVKTERWNTESQLMFCKKMDQEIKNLNLKPSEYLQSLQ